MVPVTDTPGEGAPTTDAPPVAPAPATRKNPIATATFTIDYLAGTPAECQAHAAQVVQGLRDAGLKVAGKVKIHNPVTTDL